ncbi:MAG TPA: hypothetical protein VKV27_15935 [Solirubrobacteraceae bacterium]|nr:hypothetical protein [Solirubrobacteraceae bacterium]
MAIAHLCGSMNLPDPETVFRTVARISGDTVSRMPDGETGARQDWIMAQLPRLASNSALEPAPPAENDYRVLPAFRLRGHARAAQLRFDLGYAQAATTSYPLFRRLKADGVIDERVRFQVSLPTPLAIALPFIAPEHREAVAPAIERAMAREVERIAASAPADQLAIQWDVAVEISHLEGLRGASVSRDEILSQLARIASLVPDEVELGYHLCYGDAPPGPGERGRHFMAPRDTGLLVEVANWICERAGRSIAFVHMPVPIDRDDDGYFAPLDDLRLQPATRLFLGLVHHEDGLEGTQRRIAAAARHARGFGVATECGMGRRPREWVAELLRIQRDAVVPGE